MALALILALGSFALALAIHAVHHLDDPRQGAACLVFSVGQQMAGLLAEPLELGAFHPSHTPPPNALADGFLPALFCRSAQPRAPPPPSSPDTALLSRVIVAVHS
jgi:hypothetical protein